MSGRNRFFSAVHSSSRKKLHCQWKIKMKMNPKGSNDASLWTRSVNHKPVDNNPELEMWANAQRDGRPAEYRWHPLFNAAKFG